MWSTGNFKVRNKASLLKQMKDRDVEVRVSLSNVNWRGSVPLQDAREAEGRSKLHRITSGKLAYHEGI